MPNWSTNKITIIGKQENLLAFLNKGLKNSELNTERDIPSAIKALKLGAVSKISGKAILDENENWNGLREIVIEKGITMRTFLLMDESFIRYDTTNKAKELPDAAKYQQEAYGVVGWHDYNILTLGTKWDARLENFDADEKTITFQCYTAWSAPTAWLNWIAETFDLMVFGVFTEEADFYCEVSKYTQRGGYELIEDFMPIVNAYQEETDENGDIDWDAYYERRGNLNDLMESCLFNAVCKTGKEELGWD